MKKCKHPKEIRSYETYINEGEQLYYPFVCECGFEGNEWYSLQYVETTDNKGNKID